MNNTIKFSVDSKNSGKRLDVFLAENINHLTRSFLKKLIEDEQVKLNNQVLLTPSTKIKFKDKIEVTIVKNDESNVVPKKIDLNIVYEDKDILVINNVDVAVLDPMTITSFQLSGNNLRGRYFKKDLDIKDQLSSGDDLESLRRFCSRQRKYT